MYSGLVFVVLPTDYRGKQKSGCEGQPTCGGELQGQCDRWQCLQINLLLNWKANQQWYHSAKKKKKCKCHTRCDGLHNSSKYQLTASANYFFSHTEMNGNECLSGAQLHVFFLMAALHAVSIQFRHTTVGPSRQKFILTITKFVISLKCYIIHLKFDGFLSPPCY